MSLAQQVHIDIDSFDKTVIYYDLKVELTLAGHLTFSFLWRHTDMVITSPGQEEAMACRYQGRDVIFTFRGTPGTEVKAKGVITDIDSVDEQGGSVGLEVTGTGHTMHINDMKKSRTFLDRDLQYIVREVLPAETPGDFYQWADMLPTYKKRIPYSAQYNETTFEYLKRLATRYGQWFYWDGMRLQFGVIKAGTVKLINGSSVHGFRTHSRLASQKVSLTGYDYTQNTRIQASQRKVEGGSSDSLAAHLAQKQHDYFTRDMEVSAYTGQAAGQPELENMAQLQAAAAATSIVTYSGVSYEPLWLGRSFMVLKGPVEYRLVAVSVKHLSDNHGNYRCEFIAIPEDVATPPYTDPHCYAHAESQPAKVYDNNDPEGMGRIKVHFYWGTGGSKETDWIRMVQPHSGAGKGFYFIPEIGEEVMVGFEGGNADKPYVIGTHYNGKQSSGFHTSGNDLKVFKTRSGIENRSNDAEGSWKQSTPDGNFLKFDGQGNATLNVPKDLTITVGDNFNINVGKNISFLVGLKAIYNIGVQMMMNTPILRYLIADNYHLQSPKTLINGDGEIKIEGKETNVAGFKKLFVHSNEVATINSKGTVEINGKSGTSHTNVAEKYDSTKLEVNAKAIVHFRPLDSWDGSSFGYDFMRIGDTLLKGDATSNIYEKIVGKNSTSFPDPTKFDLLENEYSQHVIITKQKKDSAGTLMVDTAGKPVFKEYYVPWLTLFPKKKGTPLVATGFSNTEADLMLYVNVDEEPDKLELRFDNTLFDINVKELTPKIVTTGTPHKVQIKIKCLKEFDTDKEIVVLAIKNKADGTKDEFLAGKLKVLANKKRYKAKIAIVEVTTNNISSSINIGNSVGREDELRKYLRQALIEPEFTTSRLSIDLSSDTTGSVPNAMTNFNGVHARRGQIWDAETLTIQNDLNTILYAKYDALGKDYRSHYKIYLINEPASPSFAPTDGAFGWSSGIPSTIKSVIVYKAGLLDSTIAHETLHAMGLNHSFVDVSKHTFQLNKTDNIMDYSDTDPTIPIPVVQLWKWQYGFIYPNIDAE
jgi:uncharacterized protein involved in type VI secretion and phage assembly